MALSSPLIKYFSQAPNSESQNSGGVTYPPHSSPTLPPSVSLGSRHQQNKTSMLFRLPARGSRCCLQTKIFVSFLVFIDFSDAVLIVADQLDVQQSSLTGAGSVNILSQQSNGRITYIFCILSISFSFIHSPLPFPSFSQLWHMITTLTIFSG